MRVPFEKILRRLEDIPGNIARIERFTKGMDFAGFLADERAVYASLHALPIVSEAARRLGAEAEALVPSQPWADIRAIGNILRHEYDGIDPDIVWRIIDSGDLASLKEAVGAAVTKLQSSPTDPHDR